MGKLPEPRELRTPERALIEFLLTADFPGRNELREQLDHVEVVGDCDCGCGTVDLRVRAASKRAAAREPIPVEARGQGLDVLLFVRDGLLNSLEIVDYLDRRPLEYPSVADLELWVAPSLNPDKSTTPGKSNL